MNTKISKSQKVREAVKTAPLLIPHFLKDPNYDNKITYGIIKQLIPFRVGVELECGGCIVQMSEKIESPDDLSIFLPNNSLLFLSELNKYIKKEITNKFKLIEVKVDQVFQGVREHKISFDYKSVKGFYQILELMKENCIINKAGGCHIHIDNIYSNTTNLLNYTGREYLRKKLSKYLEKSEEIFGEYKGEYNEKKVYINSKAGWICRRRDTGTYEFRIGKCNFEYETLIKWIIKCSSLVKEFNNIIKLTPKEYFDL